MNIRNQNVFTYGDSIGIEHIYGRRKGPVMYAQTDLKYWQDKLVKVRFKHEDNERRWK